MIFGHTRNMIPILYWISLILLLILTLLFAIDFSIRIRVDPLSLRIYLFHIRIISLKGEKLYQKIAKMEKKAEGKPPPSLLYIHLMDYLHIDRIEIRQSIQGRYDLYAILYGISEFIASTPWSKKVIFQVQTGAWDTVVDVRFHFQLGIIIGNYLCLRRQAHAKKSHTRNV